MRARAVGGGNLLSGPGSESRLGRERDNEKLRKIMEEMRKKTSVSATRFNLFLELSACAVLNNSTINISSC